MHKPIYVQMYSFEDGQHPDSRENLRTVAALGFDGVEIFGPNFDIPAQELKELTDSLGIQVISMHVPGTDSLLDMVPYAKTLGCRFIGLSMEPMRNEDEVHAWAKRMNEIGKIFAENGMMMIYHNHTQEFAPCGDERIIDVLIRETDPSCVGFELDAGWCASAGYDPIEMVQKYSGRFKLLHVKESDKVIGPQPVWDMDQMEKDELGRPILSDEIKAGIDLCRGVNCRACEGLVDWAKMVEAADANGCCGHIVERERSDGDRVEELKHDLECYRKVM